MALIWWVVQLSAATRGVYKKAVLKNFAIFTGKHLHWSLFLITLVFFSWEYCKKFKNTWIEKHQQTAASEENIQTSSVFSLWDEGCVPGQINANLQSKIRDENKCDKIAANSHPSFSTCSTRSFSKVPMKKEICKNDIVLSNKVKTRAVGL